MQHFADTHKRRTGWDGYDFSLSHMIELHDQTHDHSFSMNDLDCFKTSSNPDKSPVPDKLSAFRDQSIVQAIFDRWQEGYSIFIVYGSGHWVTQRGALETILR
jgi:hypothetical protein